jgi:chromosomal replication initiator protein
VVNGVVCISLPAQNSASDVASRFGSLGEFVVGPENRLANVAVRAALATEPCAYNPLVLLGPAGSGKSHLARGIAAEYRRRHAAWPMTVTTAAEFAQQWGRAQHSRNSAALSQQLRTSKLLVLEDLAGMTGKLDAQQELIHTIDALLDENHLVIVTCRQSPRQIDGLLDTLRSRLAGGLEVSLALPAAPTRLAILEKLAAARGTLLPKTVSRILADGLQSGVPELLGALTALEAAHRGEGRAIDASAARSYLTARQARRTLRIQPIAAASAKYFRLRLADLKGASRERQIVLARNVAMYLARQSTGQSLEKIGQFFGGRDHTTVLHGCRRVEQLAKTDPEAREAVNWLEQLLSQLMRSS